MRHLQKQSYRPVILHLIYQLRHQPFCLLQAAWLYVLCQHGIGYIQRNHHFHSLRFTVSSLEPNCGRASSTVNNPIAAKTNQNFTSGRYLETSGISCAISIGSPIYEWLSSSDNWSTSRRPPIKAAAATSTNMQVLQIETSFYLQFSNLQFTIWLRND